eukprot:CAMPEP_0175077196 /NCGR_PEP_ID=MMETSP0052_2-20121109/23233_1 /TAXON_ID=51329 ORGANISM="Polytomella parva, Strain SAG 63-3" /NCGR_SAMPLE_ID=MMETSP0052_2 /ASSEMBLY_ACC=CAM_ASM_000194 /LENGTH=290 /DNA_ID=CAMNT_0016346589 /DNA_START=125 /DNA_END=994 /DNA_ORIENTATION=+
MNFDLENVVSNADNLIVNDGPKYNHQSSSKRAEQQKKQSDAFDEGVEGKKDNLKSKNDEGNSKHENTKASLKHEIQFPANSSHVIDVRRLRASWVKNRQYRHEQAKQFVKDENEGLMRLLARHVEVSDLEWREVLQVTENVDAILAERQLLMERSPFYLRARHVLDLVSDTLRSAAVSARQGLNHLTLGFPSSNNPDVRHPTAHFEASSMAPALQLGHGSDAVAAAGQGEMGRGKMRRGSTETMIQYDASDPYTSIVMAAMAKEKQDERDANLNRRGGKRVVAHAWHPKE